MRTLLIPLLLLAACGHDSPAPQIHASLAFVSGDAQVDTVGKTLPVQLGAKLMDANSGAPLPGRILNWSVVNGGGTLFVAVTQTGSDGVGRNSWTLGPIAGEQKVVARYIDPDTGEPVTLDTARATALVRTAALLWANNDGPFPHPSGYAWNTPPMHSGQRFSLYYGFWDQYGNLGAPTCGSVAWQFGGNGGFGDDTVTLSAPAPLANEAWVQDVVITGPGVSLVTFYPTASCLPSQPRDVLGVPVNYQP